MQRQFTWRADGALGVAALAAIALVDTPLHAVWACAFLALFALVAFRWASSPAVRALARLGAISYPLYLVHETMGWALIGNLEARGIGTDAAIAAAIAAALALATLLHVAVEAPAMKWMRTAWKRHTLRQGIADTAAALHRRAWAAGTLLVGAALLVGNRLALVH
jgi:peptidoglycan/LPS O-acetylase OafA/YrhL